MWHAITQYPWLALFWASVFVLIGLTIALVSRGFGVFADLDDLRSRYAQLRETAQRHLQAYRHPAPPGEHEDHVVAMKRIRATLAEQDMATAALRRVLSIGQKS